MKKSISMLLTTGVLATGCASLPPMKGNPQDRDVNYVIEEGKETDHFEGKSDFTVVLFPEDHSLYGCQANIYLALEKAVLAGEVRFVAREGRVGPTEHTNNYFQKMRYFDRNLHVGYYKDLLELPFEERQQQARSWVQNHDFPSRYLPDINDNPLRNWSKTRPMISTVLNESVYQWIHTIGVESQETFDRAKEELTKAGDSIGKAKNILSEAYVVEEDDKKYFATCIDDLSAKLTENEKITKKEEIFTDCRDKLIKIRKNAFLVVRDEQIKYRNAGMVPNIQNYARKLSFVEGTKVLFPIGAMHVQDLTQRFKEERISYQVIEHKACEEEDIYE